ncbi:YfcE family phosphodiesterase [candidate division WOR-3 bacterium]|uniref:YfcE family phosphodiesterase n=1 Tax=candidate division WOR-3 bacterium TaxID=2052148 RepID=A0A9D5K7P1_UNCW3|nr:YfcE family phosphodiesterase [candidate division WOR-3 bacterium]MBD3363782.1 YfcE family phosphodiesterase [candidate division WOR-3 bacterium]
MKILAVTDLHGGSVEDLLGFNGIDLVLVLGDITTGGSIEETMIRINPLREAYQALYAIPGNWDRKDSCQWLISEGLSLDCRSIRIEGIILYGVGGSVTTPFSTPNEFAEEEFGQKLAGCPEPEKGERLILLSHTPPRGAGDKTALGMHVGSENLKRFIKEMAPDLVLCGHIHEGRDKTMIGKTIIVNPGPAPRHYAIVKITDGITVTLY